jgi:iron complex outermembrane receptor protein
LCGRALQRLALIVALAGPVALRGGDEPQSQPHAGEGLKQLTLEELSQIDVTTPSKQPETALRAPVAIYVITGEDIRRSGVTTIPDALRLAPGVEVAQLDQDKWSVGIRGFGTRLSRSVLVLIDGRSVYTPLFAGTYWEVQDTLLEDIDRIEVIRGPGGTIWRPNAVNGVINIITKSTADTQGSFASAGGGNVEQGFANFRYGGATRNGLTYRVYGKAFTRGPAHHGDRDNFDDWRGAQSGFRMDWKRGDQDDFTLQGDLYAQRDGERVSLGNYVPAFERTFDGNADLSGGNLLARWTRKLSAENSFQLQAYYDRTNRYEPNFGERRDTFDIDFVQRVSAGNRHHLNYGFGARFSDGRFLEVGSGLVFTPANRLDYLVSAFVDDDIQLLQNRVVLSLGSKLLRTNFDSFEAEPSVRLLWTPTERQTFWAAFTRAIRTPSRAEHDFYLSSFLGPGLFARFNANPQFAPEQLNGYETGFRSLITKNVFVDLVGYWNHYHDLFSQDLAAPAAPETNLPFPEPVPPPPHTIITAQFRNDLRGFTTGSEIAPEWRPTSNWRLRASYSLLNMNLKKAPGTALGGTPASVAGSSPRHEATAQSSLDLTKRLLVDLVYRYVSALPAVSAPAYSTGDVRAAWRAGNGFELSVAGRNLLQPRHVEFAGDPGLPVAIRRSAYVSLAWRR